MSETTKTRWIVLPAAALLGALAMAGSPDAETGEPAGRTPTIEDGAAGSADATEPFSVPRIDASVAQSRPAAPGGGGLRARIDPETGRLIRVAGPAAGEPSATAPADRLNTYGGDLVQEALPGGGFKVDLRGRFRSSVVATIDPETGETTIDCVTEPTGEEVGDGS